MASLIWVLHLMNVLKGLDGAKSLRKYPTPSSVCGGVIFPNLSKWANVAPCGAHVDTTYGGNKLPLAVACDRSADRTDGPVSDVSPTRRRPRPPAGCGWTSGAGDGWWTPTSTLTLLCLKLVLGSALVSRHCPAACATCSKLNGCLSCKPRFFFHLELVGARQRGTCLSVCPRGHYGTRSPHISTCTSTY